MRAVLLVEDSPAQQKMISTILTKNGWQVMIAEDGIQALESINESSPDLIVLDPRFRTSKSSIKYYKPGVNN